MAYAILIFYTLIIVVRYMMNRSTVALFFAWMLIAPAVTFFGRVISSSYVMLLLLAPAILLKGGKIIMPPKPIRQYLWMLLSINILYVFSWLLFNRNDPGTMISMFLGALKIALLLLFCWFMNARTFQETFLTEISRMVRWLLTLNTLVIIFQMIAPSAARDIQAQLLNETQLNLMDEILFTSGGFTRQYGIFGLPTMMGAFCLLALTYILLVDGDAGKWQKVLYCIEAMFGGITAASKTFIFGTMLLLVLIAAKNFVQGKVTKKGMLVGCTAAGAVIMLFVFSDKVYDLVNDLFGSYAARPLLFMNLDNIMQIFRSRLGLNTGTLVAGGTVDIIKRFFLFGVGVSPIDNEFVMDNAVLVILHNGGLLCLSIVLWYYGSIAWRNRRDFSIVVAILMVLATGNMADTWTLALPIWLVLSVVYKGKTTVDKTAGHAVSVTGKSVYDTFLVR